MGRFDDKVALITGASSGIGAELAREFARQGASLALLARRAERIEALAVEVRASGRDALAVPCDVTRDGDLERAVAATVERFGRLDVAVANAGFGVVGPVAKLRLDDYRRQFETNVFGTLRTIYAALPALLSSRGTLVVIGSVTGYVSTPGSSPYAMSKHAVRALADSLHGELEPQGVHTVLVSPGYVESEIRRVDNQGRLNDDVPDTVPSWLRMPTVKAARQIVRAIARRRRNVIITGHGKVIVFLVRHFPRFSAWLTRGAESHRPRSK